MSEAPVQSDRLDWPSTIGHLILNFGHLEYLVALFLKDSLEADEYARFKERPFKDRVARIAKYFDENGNSQEERENFALLLRRIEPVRHLRNHIAHGYMCWHMAEEGGTPWVSIVLPKNVDQEHLPETRRLKYGDLRASLKELDEVIAGLDRLVGFKY